MSIIITIQVLVGLGCFFFCAIMAWRHNPDPSRTMKLCLQEFVILSFAVGTATGLGISSIYYSVSGQLFPEETLDSLRTAVAVGGLVLIIGPILVLAERLKHH